MSIEAEQFTVSDTSACNPNVSGRRQYHRCPILLHLGFACEKNIMPMFLNAEYFTVSETNAYKNCVRNYIDMVLKGE